MRRPPGLGPTLAAVAIAVAALAAPATAPADTIVYMKGGGHSQGGDLMIARPDGSGARVVASSAKGHDLRWPSESDGGTIAAADVKLGPYDPSYPFFSQDLGGRFDLFDQQGGAIRSLPGFPYISTPWTVISPDGKRIAWASFDGEQRVFWEPTAAGTTGAPGQGQGQAGDAGGQVDRGRPVWLDDDTLMLTYTSSVFRLDNEPQYLYYRVGDGPDNSQAWFSDWQVDDANPSVGRDFDDFYPAVSRDHRTMAIDEGQDVTSNDTDPTRPDTWKRILRLFSMNGAPPSSTAAPTLRCQISLPGVGDDQTRHGVSFSPDGTRLALDSKAGIEIADVSDLSADASGNCLHVKPQLVISGGHEPFWSPAGLQPARRPCSGGPGCSSSGLRLSLAKIRRQRLSRLLRKGLGVRARCRPGCRLKLKLTISAKTARRYHLTSGRARRGLRRRHGGPVTVGRGAARLPAGKRKRVRVKLTGRARRRLRSAHRLTFKLKARARGGSGGATATRKVRAVR